MTHGKLHGAERVGNPSGHRVAGQRYGATFAHRSGHERIRAHWDRRRWEVIRSLKRTLLAGLSVLVAAACQEAGPENPAELVLTNGKIVAVDGAGTEVEALASRGGRIVAMGSSADVAAHIGPTTRVLDLDGRLAIPGLIEGHAHFMGVGQSSLQLDLMSVRNWDEVVAMVGAAVADADAGQLITGRGWHQEKWDARPEGAIDGMPRHETLSAISPDNPVILTHASGHATYANARAMEIAGITSETPDPDGGEIVRDEDGNPIGAFRETASGLLSPARRSATEPDPERVALLAQEAAFENGITSFQDAGSSWSTVDLWRSLVDAGQLKIRLYAMIRSNPESLAANLADYRTVGYGSDRLTVRAIKVSIDGALGSHGAWLLEPYDDLPESAGLNTTSIEDVVQTADLAIEHDYQFNVHAIGDRGNRETLDIFEATFEEAGPADRRWRIEHAQHLHPDDIPRFGQLGVIAAMQGVHATSDAPWIEPKLGEERAAQGAYVWQDLLQSGAIIVNGTDAPVEHISPIASYYSSVSRRPASGPVFLSGPENESDGSPPLIHHRRGVRRIRRGDQGFARARKAGRHHRSLPRYPHGRRGDDPWYGDRVYHRGWRSRLRRGTVAQWIPRQTVSSRRRSTRTSRTFSRSSRVPRRAVGWRRWNVSSPRPSPMPSPKRFRTRVLWPSRSSSPFRSSSPVPDRKRTRDRCRPLVGPLLDHAERYYLQPMDLIPEMTQGLPGLLDDSYLVIRFIQHLDKGPEEFLDWDLEYPRSLPESPHGAGRDPAPRSDGGSSRSGRVGAVGGVVVPHGPPSLTESRCISCGGVARR